LSVGVSFAPFLSKQPMVIKVACNSVRDDSRLPGTCRALTVLGGASVDGQMGLAKIAPILLAIAIKMCLSLPLG
jgi:hypothetical protein